MFLLKKPVKDYFPLTPLNSYRSVTVYMCSLSAVRLFIKLIIVALSMKKFPFLCMFCLTLLSGVLFSPQSVADDFNQFVDNHDGTVTDDRTGLTWMRCSMGQSWDGTTCTGTAGNYDWSEAKALRSTYVGYSDWRLPTMRELYTLVDFGREEFIDVNFFPASPKDLFVTSDISIEEDYDYQSLSFDHGNGSVSTSGSENRVRLVRGDAFVANFAVNNNQTVFDSSTKLMWVQCPVGAGWDGENCTGSSGEYSWDSALQLTSSFAGYSDWRLPTVKELTTHLDYTKLDPTVDQNIFPFVGLAETGFWSSTLSQENNSNSWYVSLFSGGVATKSVDETLSVRLVRDVAHSIEVTSVDIPVIFSSSETKQLSVIAEDAWLHPLSYQWSASCTGDAQGEASWKFSNERIANPTLTTPVNESGLDEVCRISVEVSDGHGLVVTRSEEVVVKNGAIDTDGDGVLDNRDNCPVTMNMSQEDMDGDAQGDLCDSDIDGDGVNNDEDYYELDNTRWNEEIVDHAIEIVSSNIPDIFSSDETKEVSVNAVDTLGHQLSYKWSAQCESDIDGSPTSWSFSNVLRAKPEWNAPLNDSRVDEQCTLTVKVKDGQGIVVVHSQSVTVKDRTIDTDGDGVLDIDDNCPVNTNEDQSDSDYDGVGDKCDAFPQNRSKWEPDSDEDDVPDSNDNCPLISNPGQDDHDDDGIGNFCDDDYRLLIMEAMLHEENIDNQALTISELSGWTIDEDNKKEGLKSLQFNAENESGVIEYKISSETSGKIKFWYKAGSSAALRFFIDGEMISDKYADLSYGSGYFANDGYQLSSEQWEQVVVALPPGEHVFRWEFANSGSSWSKIWIDAAEWTPAKLFQLKGNGHNIAQGHYISEDSFSDGLGVHNPDSIMYKRFYAYKFGDYTKEVVFYLLADRGAMLESNLQSGAIDLSDPASISQLDWVKVFEGQVAGDYLDFQVNINDYIQYLDDRTDIRILVVDDLNQWHVSDNLIDYSGHYGVFYPIDKNKFIAGGMQYNGVTPIFSGDGGADYPYGGDFINVDATIEGSKVYRSSGDISAILQYRSEYLDICSLTEDKVKSINWKREKTRAQSSAADTNYNKITFDYNPSIDGNAYLLLAISKNGYWTISERVFGDGNQPFLHTSDKGVPVDQLECYAGLDGVFDEKDLANFTAPVLTKRVATGLDHSYFLTDDGDVYAQGSNQYGQLAQTDIDRSATPLKVESLSNIISIAAGNNHGVALDVHGQVYTWGMNIQGQIGNGGTEEKVSVAYQVQLPEKVSSISATSERTVVVTESGNVWNWGYSAKSRVGDTSDGTLPYKIPSLFGIREVALGGSFSLALRDDGAVWSWGYCQFGACGNDSNESFDEVSLPVQVDDMRNIVSIFASDRIGMAVNTNGDRFIWGFVNEFDLGGNLEEVLYEPERLDGTEGDIIGIVRNENFFVLKSGGQVLGWGNRNDFGRLGIGTTSVAVDPTDIGLSNIIEIESSSERTFALESDGTIWGWGKIGDSSAGSQSPLFTATPVTLGNLELGEFITDYQDQDGDGRVDRFDNCPLQSNIDQSDSDADGVGDRCDLDTATLEIMYELTSGWNLIGVPFQPVGAGLSDLLKISGVDSIWHYDPSNQWRYSLVDQPSISTLSRLEAGKGYWVRVQENVGQAKFLLKGNEMTSVPSITAGWNLIGIANSALSPQQLLSDNAGHSLWGWNGENKVWLSNVSDVPEFLNSLNQLQPHEGYYIYAE